MSKKPETMPLYIAIAPIGVYLQSCVKCKHDQFVLISNNKYLACAKCKAKIAEFNPTFTKALSQGGECGDHTLH